MRRSNTKNPLFLLEIYSVSVFEKKFKECISSPKRNYQPLYLLKKAKFNTPSRELVLTK